MRIKRITKVSSDEKRYDIQTEKNHNFYANGILVHNSIMKLYWYAGAWQIATNGTINAMNTDLPTPALNGVTTFGQLFNVAFGDTDTSAFNKDYTYIFELVSPYNRVVVPYRTLKLYHIGTRVNATGEELNVSIGFDKPKQYAFQSFDDMVATAAALPFDEEGYVVVDAQWHRVKVKSLAYLACHRLKGESFSRKRALELVQTGEHEEFLAYFPEYNELLAEVSGVLLSISNYLQQGCDFLDTQSFATRKEYALKVKDLPFSAFFFQRYEKQIDVDTFIASLSWKELERYIEDSGKVDTLPAFWH